MLDLSNLVLSAILLVVGPALTLNLSMGDQTDQLNRTAGSTDIFMDDSCEGPLYECVEQLATSRVVLVTGGAGFVGSHLVDSLMLAGHRVIVVDDLSTGDSRNIEHWMRHKNFKFIRHDVELPLKVEYVDQIFHLASPASPKHYMKDPIKTLRTITLGTINLLDLAERYGARIVIASTSEIYGDPQVHPQSESYWGNVNPNGPRSCYDEGKRVSESLASAYTSTRNLSVGIARIFNTYGPRMQLDDGRVVSNFIIQTLQNLPQTIYGSGKQTRSFQYVSDLVLGLRRLMSHNISGPVNLGNPNEITIQELSTRIKSLIPQSNSGIVYSNSLVDDPHRRKPSIDKAKELLGWIPAVDLNVGLNKTISYFRKRLATKF